MFDYFRRGATLAVLFAGAMTFVVAGRVASAADSALAKALGGLSPVVFPSDKREAESNALSRDLRQRLQAANDASSAAWGKIETRSDWRAFRDRCVENLRASLGRWPNAPTKVPTHITGRIDAEGYAIEKLVYESRPGMWVTANLYRPLKPSAAAGILLSHSHHAPKQQGELQEMGATWARAGCYVLAIDHLGHGERAQHGFKTAANYPREFRVSRQDYYFRYDSSIQLYLAGESLMGRLAWDLMRGVDVLLAQPGIDAEKIALLGGVAGGGDPCAVAAALDERIACAVPFNFGGPQPETRYPLPLDVETSFNYAGGGSWESTRNVAHSAVPGKSFLHWEIVAAIAPRRLIYGHEFAWDRERDPVWKRLERIWTLRDVRDWLAFAHGRGLLSGQPPEATHCGNIGAFHRRLIHDAFARWFAITANEYSQPRSAGDLRAMTDEAARELKPRMLHESLTAAVDEMLAAARSRRSTKSPAEVCAELRRGFDRLLGNTTPVAITTSAADVSEIEGDEAKCAIERLRLKTERDMELPLIILRPQGPVDRRRPALIGLSQSGKSGFIKHRAAELARLVEAGMLVCLVDVRDTGETADGDDRGQWSASTDRAATALMVGDPLVGQQLRDARAALAYVRSRGDVDGDRVGVWGASFAPVNDAGDNFQAPRRIDGRPHDVEPLGGMLALLTAFYDDRVAAVCVDGGMLEFRGVLDSPFVYVPLESVVPGMLTHADLVDVAAAIAPRPMLIRRPLDAMNRTVSAHAAASRYRIAVEAYDKSGAKSNLTIAADDDSAAEWFINRMNLQR